MSQHFSGTTDHSTDGVGHSTTYARRISTETKASFKTTEFFAYLAAVVGVLVASAMVDDTDFGAQTAWKLVTYLTIGYMVARGLAKSGSREPYDDRAEV